MTQHYPSKTDSERITALEGLVKRLYERFGCTHGKLDGDGGLEESCEECVLESREWMASRMESHP